MMGPKAPQPKLIAIVKYLASADPELGIERFDISDAGQRDASVEVGVVHLGATSRVRLTLVSHSPPTQAVVEGCRAHHRYLKALGGRHQEMVVMPQVTASSPIFLTPHVAITSLHASVIRAALRALSHQCHPPRKLP